MQPEVARCLPGSRDGMLWRVQTARSSDHSPGRGRGRGRGRGLDVDAARRALTACELTCPQQDCGGILRIWSAARPRQVDGLDGTALTLTPDRARCRSCKATATLLPTGGYPGAATPSRSSGPRPARCGTSAPTSAPDHPADWITSTFGDRTDSAASFTNTHMPD